MNYSLPDRSSYEVKHIIGGIWKNLNLPKQTLKSLSLPGSSQNSPSSFKVGPLAQSTIAVSALSAALFHATRSGSDVPKVTVPIRHATIEFMSEKFWKLNGKQQPFPKYPIGGMHRTSDGWVRIHDAFPNHRDAALKLLGLDQNASKEDITCRVLKWKALDLEEQGLIQSAVIAKLRSFEEWDALPQAGAIHNFPVSVRKIETRQPSSHSAHQGQSRQHFKPVDKTGNITNCLKGIRVLELSRVIAAPVAGRTLAAHGADVIWVTSPNLPDLPDLDPDMSRGKRRIYVDLKTPEGRQQLLELAREADVFLQGYRPGSLKALGLGPEDVAAINPCIVYANLSAYGPVGLWSHRRGFDSIVQTCSGINVAEGEAFDDTGNGHRTLPCQALDHGSGYLLATGINAALYRREIQGGAWVVDVSLAGTMKYLRSLGQSPVIEGGSVDVAEAETYLETKRSAFGDLSAIKHSASIDGLEVGWDIMPKPVGHYQAVWL